MSSNVIGVVKRESLQGMAALKSLNLARNELSAIGEGTFKDTKDIQHMDLSGNRFTKFEQASKISYTRRRNDNNDR